uniref:BTB domain-containing protein n=1 Tax=Accipiter nisus TaxID=211598 RepID=A0A8B9MAK8_9AVES
MPSERCLSVQEMLTGQRLCQSSSHNNAVLAALNQQRSDGILCDITLIAEEQKFHAHKAVLAACSDYFRVSPRIFCFFSCNTIKNYPGGNRNGYRYHTE